MTAPRRCRSPTRADATGPTRRPGVRPDRARGRASRSSAPARGRFSSTLVVIGYPREVWPGWLGPADRLPRPGRRQRAHHPGRPGHRRHPAAHAAGPAGVRAPLRRRTRPPARPPRRSRHRGRLPLADRVARGEGRLFHVGLSLTVHAADEPALAARVEQVRALAAGLLWTPAPPPTARCRAGSPGSRSGWTGSGSTAPSTPTRSPPRSRWPPPTSPAPDPPAPPAARRWRRAPAGAGCCTGTTSARRSLVFWDRFACDNYNAVILGRSGAGKSYLVKLELLRSLYRGIHAHVIDPEDEYTRLAARGRRPPSSAPAPPGCTSTRSTCPCRTRPRRARAPRPADALTRRALFLHTFLAVLLGEPLSAIERAVLDTAITATYTARRDHRRPAPPGRGPRRCSPTCAPPCAHRRPRHPADHARPARAGDRSRRSPAPA